MGLLFPPSALCTQCVLRASCRKSSRSPPEGALWGAMSNLGRQKVNVSNDDSI
jgi:hypothetical protein